MREIMDPQIEQQAYREYLENLTLSAHPVEIVCSLYHVAISSLNAAIGYLHSGDAYARARMVTKAEKAVHELILALDHSVRAPFTRTLADLYRYILDQIVKGHGYKSEQAFRDALAILTTLESAWTQVKAEVTVAPEAEEPATPERVDQSYGSYGSVPTGASSRDWTG